MAAKGENLKMVSVFSKKVIRVKKREGKNGITVIQVAISMQFLEQT